MLKRLFCLAMLALPVHADTPPPGLPALTHYEPLPFPESLRLTSVADGYALMLFTIDAKGEVEDAVAIEASHPAFAETVGEGLAKWRFEPAASQTVPRRELVQFDFRRTGMVAALSQRDASKNFFPDPSQSAPVIRTVEWEALKWPPMRTNSVLPAYPQSLLAAASSGTAVVDCIIDTTGAVRVPVVTQSSDPRFGEEALKAIRQWRFATPIEDGEPVNVRLTRSFNFGGRTASR